MYMKKRILLSWVVQCSRQKAVVRYSEQGWASRHQPSCSSLIWLRPPTCQMAHCPVRCPAPPTSDWLIWCPMEQRTPRLVLLEEPYQGQRIHQSIHPADGGTGLDTASILVNKRETQSEKALNWGYFSIFKYHSSCHPPHSSFLNSLCLAISFNFLQYCVYYMYVCIYLFIHMFVFQRTVTWDLCVFVIVFVCRV